MDINKKITEIGIIPVISIDDANNAVPLARALAEGGIPVVEITLRTAAALSAIENIRRELPEMLIGAGTVLQKEQVDSAILAGADFIVSPGFNPKTVEYCLGKGVSIFPGAVTASDIELGIELGLSVFKFFPCEQAGGLKAIDLLSGPFPQIRFIPTGGITLSNLAEYMQHKRIAAAGGSFVAKTDMINKKDWAGITALSRQAVAISMGFELAHVGINHDTSEEAVKTAEWFCGMFGLPRVDHNSSVFAGKAVECVRTRYHGQNGHIGIYTASMERALASLRKRGVAFYDDEIKCNAKGELVSAYLREEIAGFAVHIVQK